MLKYEKRKAQGLRERIEKLPGVHLANLST